MPMFLSSHDLVYSQNSSLFLRLILVKTDHPVYTNCWSSRGIQGHWPSRSRQFILSQSFFSGFYFCCYVYSRFVCTHVVYKHVYAITNALIWSLLCFRWKLHTVLVLKWYMYINFRIYLNFISDVFTCSSPLFALQLPFLYHISSLYISVVESHICMLKCFIYFHFFLIWVLLCLVFLYFSKLFIENNTFSWNEIFENLLYLCVVK